MRPRLAALLVVPSLVVHVLLATPAAADPTVEGSTDVRHLELGDGYEVIVRRHGVKQRYQGMLVHKTDEWLVLRTLSEGRSEVGVPVMSKVPYVNRLFRNVGIGRTTADRWIPRDVAEVVGRSIATEQPNFVPLTADQPAWDEVDGVESAEEGEVVHHNGSMTLQGDTLHYTVLVGHEVETPWPVLGQLPGVRGVFTSRETVFRGEGREVALASVLSVVARAPEERVGVDFDWNETESPSRL